MRSLCKFSITRTKPAFFKVSEAAQKRLRQIINDKKDEKIIGVKISLSKKGCNGMSYNMDYIKQYSKFDEVVEVDDFKVIIDSKALMAVIGTQMDFVEDEIKKQFVFINPNEKGRCGCGESFHL